MRTQSILYSQAAVTERALPNWLAALLLLLLAVLIRLPGFDHPVAQPVQFADELYTVLAARGWLAEGVPTIGEGGLYARAQYYTALIAQLFRVFDESPIVARLPSLGASVLVVVAVFLWTRSVAGALAAWIAALLVTCRPS